MFRTLREETNKDKPGVERKANIIIEASLASAGKVRAVTATLGLPLSAGGFG